MSDTQPIHSDTQPIHIVSVQQDQKDGIFVTFSDGTWAGYVVEELLELRPMRDRAKPTAKDVG
jgi:hypothetical protein